MPVNSDNYLISPRSVRLIIQGKVQGVFYRVSAREVAVGLGLSGWVRNRCDGTVESLAFGEQERLEQFVDWCQRGPSGARVDNVEAFWDETRASDADCASGSAGAAMETEPFSILRDE